MFVYLHIHNHHESVSTSMVFDLFSVKATLGATRHPDPWLCRGEDLGAFKPRGARDGHGYMRGSCGK